MMKECPFESRSKCDSWVDYQVTCATLQEAEELCSNNWGKISYLLDRVEFLESLLKIAGIEIPES